jgi:hypothetical protein
VVTSYAVAPAGEYNVETGGQLEQYAFRVHDPETKDMLARLNGKGGVTDAKGREAQVPIYKEG